MFRLVLAAVLFSSCVINSQNKIKGQVVGDSLGIAGATVQIQNTSVGTITDLNGYFEIMVKKEDVLIASHLGFQSDSVKVDNSDKLKIRLQMGVELEECVVNTNSMKSRCTISCGTTCFTTSCGFSVLTVNNFTREQSQKFIKLVPNPSSDGIFQLSTIKDLNVLEYSVYEINGKIIKSIQDQSPTKKVRLDLHKKGSGMYVIKVKLSNHETVVKKLLRI